MNVSFKRNKISGVLCIGGRDTVNQMPGHLVFQSCSLTLEECLQEAEPQFSNHRAKAESRNLPVRSSRGWINYLWGGTLKS